MRKPCLNILFYFLLLTVFSPAYSQLRETVILHTDKASYQAGEIIWFRTDIVDGATNAPLMGSRIVYAELLDSANLPVMQGKIGIENATGQGSFLIPVHIRSGSYIIRAYTNWMKNFPAEHFFKKNISIYNIRNAGNIVARQFFAQKQPHDKQLLLSVMADKTIFQTREKIKLEITSDSFAGMSVSVFLSDSMQQQLPANKAAYQHTYSDSTRFLPEYAGHIITGRITHNQTGEPAAGVPGYLFVPGRKNLFSVATSDPEGVIQFNVKNFYGGNEIMVQAGGGMGNNYRFEINDPFSGSYIARPNTSTSFMPQSTALLQESINAQVQFVYHSKNNNEFAIPSIDSSAFYGEPDLSYAAEDYIRFQTMEEVLREFVVPVGLQRRNRKLFPFIYDALTRRPFDSLPLIIIDGVPVFEAEKLLGMHPSIIARINVVNCKYFLGRNVFEGIIDIDTKVGYLDSLELDKDVTILSYDGMQLHRKFYSPAYDTPEQRASRLPDFRNVLYWSPNIKTDDKGKATIEFYSSDVKGEFAIVVNGISSDGKSGSATSFIKVQ